MKNTLKLNKRADDDVSCMVDFGYANPASISNTDQVPIVRPW
jgi:hypothetical protein